MKKSRKMLIVILCITCGLLLIFSIASSFFKKPKVSKEEQQEAKALIETMYPDFTCKESDSEIRAYQLNGYSPSKFGMWRHTDKDDYYAVYTFYGTMDTPEQTDDSVVVQMAKCKNSPFYSINDDTEWSGMIYENKADGKKWDLNFNEK